ncbi:MAG: ATP synthase F1 subunit epsilon [Rhodospirillaceae bacterium]
MVEKVEFELVSPEELLISQPVDMVVVPGGEGYYGVLAGHIPMITTVRSGAICLYEGMRIMDRIFVTGGFAEVTFERVTVLVEKAIKVSDLDRASVEQEIKNLIEDVEDAKNEDERLKVAERLEISRNMLQAIVEAAAYRS